LVLRVFSASAANALYLDDSRVLTFETA